MTFSSNHLIAGLILSGLFAFGCKRDHKKSDAHFELSQEFISRGNLYCELSKADYQAKKYVHSKCDGAGFTSLYSVRCGDVDLSVFEDLSTGKPYRSPSHDCFANGESKSEYSRDMLLMRMVAAWVDKDIEWVNRIISYGEKNSWVICNAIDDAIKVGRCVVSPALYFVLYDMQDRMSGKTLLLTMNRESDDAVGLKFGFEAHLDVLRIWLEGEVYGALTAAQLTRLEAYAGRENQNALFLAAYAKYANGDMSHAAAALDRYPKDRLPGSADWCEEYLWQRDQTSDNWKTCPAEGEIFSGTDYNFTIYMMSGK